jgi:hypothetical protein
MGKPFVVECVQQSDIFFQVAQLTSHLMGSFFYPMPASF